MKAFLLITTAVVALGTAPAFAGGMKTMQSSAVPPMTTEMKPPASLPGGCPHNQPMCGGLVQTEDGRIIRPNRMQQDAREAPVTADLNNTYGVQEIPASQMGAVPLR